MSEKEQWTNSSEVGLLFGTKLKWEWEALSPNTITLLQHLNNQLHADMSHGNFINTIATHFRPVCRRSNFIVIPFIFFYFIAKMLAIWFNAGKIKKNCSLIVFENKIHFIFDIGQFIEIFSAHRFIYFRWSMFALQRTNSSRSCVFDKMKTISNNKTNQSMCPTHLVQCRIVQT